MLLNRRSSMQAFMRRWYMLVPLALTLAVSACGTKIHQAAKDPQTRQAEATAQKALQECIPSIRSGKTAVKVCLSKRLDQTCVERDTQHANFLTHGGRQAVETKLARCVR